MGLHNEGECKKGNVWHSADLNQCESSTGNSKLSLMLMSGHPASCMFQAAPSSKPDGVFLVYGP